MMLISFLAAVAIIVAIVVHVVDLLRGRVGADKPVTRPRQVMIFWDY